MLSVASDVNSILAIHVSKVRIHDSLTWVYLFLMIILEEPAPKLVDRNGVRGGSERGAACV